MVVRRALGMSSLAEAKDRSLLPDSKAATSCSWSARYSVGTSQLKEKNYGAYCIDNLQKRMQEISPNGQHRSSGSSRTTQLGHIQHLLEFKNINYINSLLTLYGHIKTAQQQTIVQQYGDWYTGRWWVGCYIWYSKEGSGQAGAPPSPLLVAPNVSAHPSTASVPTSYYLMWHYNCLWTLKG